MPAERNPELDAYFRDASRWREELEQLRRIVLDCGLREERKWRQPCYAVDGGNVLVISGFKEYCALNMFKGALLKDPAGILVQAGENTRSARQIRFTSVEEILELEPVLKDYIREAASVERAGLEVDFEASRELDRPEELQAALDDDPAYAAAFDALTPGRRRGYVLHFADAKQSKTRAARVAKHRQRILDGKGIHDR